MTETAGPPLSRTCYATLWLWPGRAIYRGASLQLDTHSGSVACLAVGVDAAFTVHVGRVSFKARSALIPARTPHRLVAHGAEMIFAYLDPGTPLERACRRQMKMHTGPIAHGHRHEDALLDFEAPEAWLAKAAATEGRDARLDPRVRAAAAAIVRDPCAAESAAFFAERAGLSTSRFLHLFQQETSTTFRRYRLWARMLRAGAALTRGGDLTSAAMDAGFSSSAHFSSAFHAMFGVPPSRLYASTRIVFAESAAPSEVARREPERRG
ncbi:helix-turn-helix domain-containing protein [Pendulispora brunnea]|uniref:Helix-turn-helix domain-containing protein n=1 Tax=Pendulispora brunnea TaxID=2905690 RepID=A0ABZ2K4V5_9BACT